jgi:hypothetical protein
MTRGTIRTGNVCANCGEDSWAIYAGHNRCDCGQRLWLVKIPGTDIGEARYRYTQGAELPPNYVWLKGDTLRLGNSNPPILANNNWV